MRCASCGKENPPGARYCVRCGVEHALPTPIAAVAAAGGRLRAVAPPAAKSSQAAPDAAAGRDTDARPRLWDATKLTQAKGAATPAERPAADANPHPVASHTLIGAALAIAVVALLVAAFVLWRWFAVNDTGDAARAGGTTSTSSSTPDVAPHSSPYPPSPAPAAASSAPSPESNGDGDATTARRASAQDNSEAAHDARASVPASTVEAPIEIKPLPPRAVAARAQRRSAAQKAPEPAPAEVVSAPQPAEPPAPVVAAAPPVAEAVEDRWTRMNDERSRCTREDFIARVICDQRVRLRYCNGYWGKVAQCPANPNTSEHGQ